MRIRSPSKEPEQEAGAMSKGSWSEEPELTPGARSWITELEQKAGAENWSKELI